MKRVLILLLFVLASGCGYHNSAEEKWDPEVMDQGLNEIYQAFLRKNERDLSEYANGLAYKKFEDWRGVVVSKDGNIYGVKLLDWIKPEKIRVERGLSRANTYLLIPVNVSYEPTDGRSWNVGDRIAITGNLHRVHLILAHRYNYEKYPELHILKTENIYVPGEVEFVKGLKFEMKITSAK